MPSRPLREGQILLPGSRVAICSPSSQRLVEETLGFHQMHSCLAFLFLGPPILLSYLPLKQLIVPLLLSLPLKKKRPLPNKPEREPLLVWSGVWAGVFSQFSVICLPEL